MKIASLSIRQKVLTVTMLTCGASLLLACVVFFVSQVYSSKNAILNQLVSIADIVGANSADALLANNPSAGAMTLASLRAESHIDVAALYGTDGKVFAQYCRADVDSSTPGAPELRDAMDPGLAGHVSVFKSIYADGERIGSVYIRSDTSGLRELLVRYAIISIGILLVSAMVAWLVSIRLQSVISGPMLNLIGTVRRISDQTDYSQRAPGAERGDEIGALVRSFNGMLEKIEHGDYAIRVAHAHLERKVEERTSELKQEIAVRERAEKDLRLEKERAQMYLDMAAVMIVVMDVSGDVVRINRKGCEITGYSEAELVGKNWFDTMLPPISRAQLMDGFREMMAGRLEFMDKHENPIVTKGGKHRLIAWQNTLLVSSDGSVTGALCAGDDITDRKKLEEELLRNQKLESVGVFAGGIAHDFNNFLMAILGNIELAKSSVDDKEELLSMLAEAERAASQARGLTKQLMTFAKGGQPSLKTMSVVGLVRTAVTFPLTGSNVSARFDIPDDLWPATIDQGQIEQVITNLVVNARQAMPDGGHIHVSLRNVAAAESVAAGFPEGDFIELTVRDEGMGMAPQILPKIFDPYFTTKRDGTGLGLASTYAIISKHGGKITVESQVGVGTTFKVYLPAARSVGVEQAEERKAPPIKSGARILVMDDDPMIVKVVEMMLKRAGCSVVVACKGEEAVELYDKSVAGGLPFDAVILDMIIPGGMGGKDAAQAIIARHPGAKLIASSGYASDPIISDFAQFGFSGAIAKPYKKDDLAHVLHDVMAP